MQEQLPSHEPHEVGKSANDAVRKLTTSCTLCTVLRRSGFQLDEFGNRGNLIDARDTVDQVTPKRDLQLSAGFLEAGEGIPTASSSIAAGPTTDLVFLYVIADISLTTVGVKGDIGALQNQEQFGLIAMDSLEGLIEGLKTCFLGEDRIEANL